MWREGRPTVVLSTPHGCPREVRDLMTECWQRDDQERPSFREIHLFLQRKNLGFNPQDDDPWFRITYNTATAALKKRPLLCASKAAVAVTRWLIFFIIIILFFAYQSLSFFGIVNIYILLAVNFLRFRAIKIYDFLGSSFKTYVFHDFITINVRTCS